MIAGVEPVDFASPEDMESRRNRFRVVERRNTEVDRFRLVVHLHQKRCATFAAKASVAEAGRGNFPYLFSTLRPDQVTGPDACENHCRGAAIELAGPAVAPAAIEGFALQ